MARWRIGRLGSIPTCVGQPFALTADKFGWWVYPHVCGATRLEELNLEDNQGLSPRVWGNPAARHVFSSSLRSIPTCVGQPDRGLVNPHAWWVYPHVCGATTINDGDFCYIEGLSPRVWGNLHKTSLFCIN